MNDDVSNIQSYNSSIFISYRRKDTGGHTGRLYDRLTQWFDSEDIFYDQSGIESGEHFPTEIQNALDSAQVIIVVIGPDWLSDENRERLDDTKDFVRHEVLCALKRREHETTSKPHIIPVLVGGAKYLVEDDLPTQFLQLSFIQSHQINSLFADYNRQIEELCRIISSHCSSWIAKHSDWMRTCLSDKQSSTANFGQNITVLHPDSHYIQRVEATVVMDAWWAEWQNNYLPFALLGEEGDGKSWALMSWVADKLSHVSQKLPVVFVSAPKVSEAGDFLTEMAEAMARAHSSLPANQWKERLESFVSDTSCKTPQLVLVIDGLNERFSLDWRDLFSTYLTSPLRSKVALMISCRAGYWQEHLAREYNQSATIWRISPFNDVELDQALARHSLTRFSFSDRVLKLVAKPRYFDMAVRLKDQLEESGDDVTIDRLIYEDWRDRTGRKRSPDVRISHTDFHALITDLVNEYGERVNTRQLARTLSVYGNQAEIRVELVSSGILKDLGGGRFEIAPNPLILGLGLLLANEIEESGAVDIRAIEEIIAERLGEHPDSDRLVEVCAMALFHALLTDGYPDAGCIALFRKWISGRNLNEADSERVSAYFPLKPHVYFQVMEDLWGNFGNYREVEDHLMSALLQRHNYEHAKSEMITTFERWLGFVHPLGYKGWFKRDESENEDLIKEVAERLGRPFGSDPMVIYSYCIEIMPDQRLLKLAQVAESVISHFDREPFVQALCNGALATAVMGGSHVDFRWVIRTASHAVLDVLLAKSRELIASGEALALRTAYYLLSWLCNDLAIMLRDGIPGEYAFDFWQKEWRKNDDPCNSVRYLWHEDNYLESIQNTQLDAVNIAENLKEVAINPACVLPKELSEKIVPAIDYLDLNQNRSHRSQTQEDSIIDNIEPALCAYAPENYAELNRRLANQLDDLDILQCRLLASKLYEQLPVMTDAERKSIVKAWRLSRQGNGEEADHAESALYPMVIFDYSSSEQLRWLSERGNKTQYSEYRGSRYRDIKESQYPDLIARLDAVSAFSPGENHNFLWCLTKALLVIDEEIRTRLLTLVKNEDSVIRYMCLEIICQTEDQIAAQLVIENGWHTHADNCDYENFWGSVLLVKFGKHVSFAELSERISLHLLGYAVQVRGNCPDELADYAQRLHTIWTRVAKPSDSDEEILRHVKISVASCHKQIEYSLSIELNQGSDGVKLVNYTWGGSVGLVSKSDLDKSFNPQLAEQEWERIHKQVMAVYAAEKARGNHWIDSSFTNGNLDAVITGGFTYWQEWIKPILAGSQEGRRLLAFCQGLYESLCAELLNHDPATGAELFKAIMRLKTSSIVDSRTGIPHILFSLFEAQESPHVIALWNEQLNDCDSDKELSELAYLAQFCGKSAWLDSKIQAWLTSEHNYDKARALRLMGFLIDSEHTRQLELWLGTVGHSWLNNLAKVSLRSSNHNSWARIWIERFIAEEDRAKSWTAFRLFLRCVDKRFWIWKNDRINVDSLPLWKRDAFLMNIGTIIDAIKENEKKLKDTFIWHEVKENQLWPWMKKYM